jgi:NAD(P)-dependent dehydrogenase (short-subunit alcohol dehydrogenase family)
LECSKEGLDYNIRVNSIHPGVIETPLVKSSKKIEGMTEIFNNFHPMGHLGNPEDIAYGVLSLASDESKFSIGSELVIDGGWTCR